MLAYLGFLKYGAERCPEQRRAFLSVEHAATLIVADAALSRTMATARTRTRAAEALAALALTARCHRRTSGFRSQQKVAGT